MGAIVIRTRFDEGMESAEVATSVDKGVAILDLPMILLPNEIINKCMQNMKN
jgi:hypothetical protein